MADTNMDIDMEIDFGDGDVDPEIARLNAEAAALEAKQKENETTEAMNGVEEAPEDGEVDMNATVPKVFIFSEGIQSLNTRDLGNYAREHYSEELFKHVQWVNDQSANLVYDTPVAAAEALQAFSTETVADSLQLRAAKPLSTHPDVELSVRMATESDVKVKNAHEYSAYYLNNHSIDPENPHNNRRGGKRRYGDRGYRERDYSYKRRRPEDEMDRYSRRSSRDEPFDVDLYDDKPEARQRLEERRESYSSGEGRRRKVRYTDDQEELMPKKDNGRLRNRSASPGRETSGLYGFEESQPRRKTARPRSPTPPALRASTNRGARDLLRKELFPGRNGSPALQNGSTNGTRAATPDLFPNHSSPLKGNSRELFPNHKRHDARDIDNEYIRKVSDSIGRCSLDGAGEGDDPDQYTYSTSDSRSGSNGKQRDMFDRMGIKADKTYGRLADTPFDDSYSIKGAGGGFSILGASKDKVENPLVKELFPMKSGSGSKDLFDGRIKGRGRPKRNQAEDLF